MHHKKMNLKECNMIRILTDTGSDISVLEAPTLNMTSLALDIKFPDLPYDPLTDIDHSAFFDTLMRSKGFPVTSLCSPNQFLEVFEDAKQKNDEVVVITLSSGLSGTYSSAIKAQEMCEYDGITVIDSLSATLGQRMLAQHAVTLRDAGKTRAEIESTLLDIRGRLTVFGMLDTLTYLKKGGRIPPAMAFIGNALQLKPMIFVQNEDGKLGQFGKARGTQAGKRMMWERFETYTVDDTIPVQFAYTVLRDKGEEFMNETCDKYGIKGAKIFPMGGVIGAHLGPGVLVIAFVKK
jgi:DegV family protein with EDD domain